MSVYLGIDLGTCFSSMAYMDETGRPKIINNSNGENITASCVGIIDGNIEVGSQAEKLVEIDGERAVGRFKRSMGSSTKTYKLGGKEYTPRDLSAEVLKKLKNDAEEKVGPIKEAVITVPANFMDEQRNDTIAAAEAAGLEVKYIINEPTAAALYYAFKTGTELSGTYAVYDLGGGTFDITLVRVMGEEVEVMVSNGIQKLGGDDFDKALLELVENKFKQETGNSFATGGYTKLAAENDKKSLSNRVNVAANIVGERHIIKLTRDEFEDAIHQFIVQCEMLCQATLEEAGVKTSDIKGVFLAGGSTRSPCVEESVKKIFNQEPIKTVNVDEVVALGAALYGAYKSDGVLLTPAQKEAVGSLKVSEVTNAFYGTLARVVNPATEEHEIQNSIMIEKNTSIPCEVMKKFYTVSKNQTSVNCQVTESKNPETDPAFVFVKDSANLSLPPNRPEGQVIEITYAYSINQTMSCTFKDVASGKEIHIRVEATKSGERPNNIEKFLVE